MIDGTIEITPAAKHVNEKTYKNHYIDISKNAKSNDAVDILNNDAVDILKNDAVDILKNDAMVIEGWPAGNVNFASNV